MSGWEQVAGAVENDPIKLAESGEKQQWSFHGHVFDFECRTAPHRYQLIPNGVQLEMSIIETGGAAKPIECSEVAIQAGDGAELLSDFDAFARINAEAKVREIFAYAGKMVLAREELEQLAHPEAPAEDATA
ncbi:MAG TPA: hypothetical protein VMH50_02450 [Thermoleophilia bacterium]|nr:hypothetical protein [Thermoleophilia bacterium]